MFVACARAQHHQVTHMVWHFVRQYGQRGDSTQTQIRDERGRDQHTIAEAMHAVAGQHRPSAGHWLVIVLMQVRRMFVMVLMSVMPQLSFIKQEEEDQPHQ